MRRVLVVDDDDDLLMLFSTVLAMDGLHVDVAANGPAAIVAMTTGEPPDLLVLDVQMPGVDGWMVLEQVRAHPDLAAVPVLLCTVKGRPVDRARGWELGCDGYVAKPFDPPALLAAARLAMSRTAPERVAFRVAALNEARRQIGSGPP